MQTTLEEIEMKHVTPVELSSAMHLFSHKTKLPESVQRIVLTGFMGAGKSSAGRALAKKTGWEFADLDSLIEERTELTVHELFERVGEAGFRKHESGALVRALGRKNVVLALGGGALETLTNRLLLEQTPATLNIFLHAPFSVLHQRVNEQANGAVRPNFADAIVAEQRFLARLPFYQRTAGFQVDTTDHNLEQTVDALIEGILKHAGEVRP